MPIWALVRGGWPRKKLLYAQNSKNQRWLEALQSAICPEWLSPLNMDCYTDGMPCSGLSQWNGYIAILFNIPHPSAEFSGSENGHIREKIDLHIHWMSDSRQSIIYKRMCKLQKCRIYPKSQVKNIGEGCGNLGKQEICPNHVLLRGRALKQAIYQSNSLTLCMQHSKAASMEPWK